MIKLILMTCAQNALIDRNTNHVSLINLLEEITSPSFPVGLAVVTIFTYWRREADDPDIKVKAIIKLNDEQLFEGEMGVEFQATERCRAILVLSGLVLMGPGTLSFEIATDTTPFGKWIVPVKGVPSITPPAG